MGEPTPSSQRIEPGSVNHKPYPWPASLTEESIDAAAIAQNVIHDFNWILADKPENLADFFVEDGFWRDHVATSWHLRTLRGREKIRAFLTQGCNLTRVEIDDSSDFRKPQVINFAPDGDSKGIAFYTKITTKHGSGRGVVRLIEKDDAYRIWVFFTTLEGLTGFEEPLGPRRALGVQHGGQPGRKNWLDRRKEETTFTNSEPDVLIVGKYCLGFSASVSCEPC